MTNPDEEARTRAADKRIQSAERIREIGSTMMIAGGVGLAIALTAFALEPRITPWGRGAALAVILMLWVGGFVSYISGRLLYGALGQMADDRAERAAQHDEEMLLLRDIRRNQTFLLARPGVEGALTPTYRVREEPLPSADTLYNFRKWRDGKAAEAEQPKDVVDPKYLADMSEAVRLGEELARRKLQPPPDQVSN